MKSFDEFVHKLEKLASAALAGNDAELLDVDFSHILNGGVGDELRRRVPLEDRQRIGAFFTGASLRSRALSPTLTSEFNTSVWDPACGAGDLLLSYAEKLQLHPDIGQTVLAWGSQLFGSDTECTFVRAAKARLVLKAYHRGARKIVSEGQRLQSLFPNIRLENSLIANNRPNTDSIVINPPFVMIKSDHDCEWGRGNVSAAAVFVESCLKQSMAGTKIVAILPDVLRTGTRYGRWRRLVQEFASIKRIDVYGPFDPQADVDVFILELEVLDRRLMLTEELFEPWAIQQVIQSSTIGDFCSVSVGSVVPHRHKEEGPELAYLHTKDAIRWGTLDDVPARRRFNGTCISTPFVVIRRTSSPSDKERAIATIINCPGPVAVENHLIVIQPNNKSLEACEKIFEVLRSSTTNDWLNSRIRCRHLTVDSVKNIPWVR